MPGAGREGKHGAQNRRRKCRPGDLDGRTPKRDTALAPVIAAAHASAIQAAVRIRAWASAVLVPVRSLRDGSAWGSVKGWA